MNRPENRPENLREGQPPLARAAAVIAVTGSNGRLGQRVMALLADEPSERVARVVAIDRDGPTPINPRIRFHRADLAEADIPALLAGCTAVIHLASSFSPDDLQDDAVLARRVCDAAAQSAVRTLVLISSAAVYGAWPDNPVPITEAHQPNPNPGFAFASSRLELEAVGARWRDGAPGRSVAILRPAVTPSLSGQSGWLARAVGPSKVDLLLATPPPVQFVHLDDVASAALHAAVLGLDGVFNVAPDKWLRGEDAPPLMGMAISIPATGPVREVASALVRGVVYPLLALGPRPAGALPWSRYPWVVANDRLRATGWAPLSSTEEVLVAQRPPSKVARIFARRRQEVTIAALGGVGLGTVGAAAAFLRRWARRR
jgi:nucleoside-diphosphate-sugar epimerase